MSWESRAGIRSRRASHRALRSCRGFGPRVCVLEEPSSCRGAGLVPCVFLVVVPVSFHSGLPCWQAPSPPGLDGSDHLPFLCNVSFCRLLSSLMLVGKSHNPSFISMFPSGLFSSRLPAELTLACFCLFLSTSFLVKKKNVLLRSVGLKTYLSYL